MLQRLILVVAIRSSERYAKMKRFIKEIKKHYLILKYADLIRGIRKNMILHELDFDQVADNMLLTRTERLNCINIMKISASIEDALKIYFDTK